MTDDIPFAIEETDFNMTIRGIFGRFQTQKSYKLNYILASIPYSQIDQLSTAADAINIRDPEVDFAQIIQRDVNYARVADMVGNYLSGSVNKVVFFPPLLVSLAGVRDKQLVKKYDSTTAEFKGDTFVQQWNNGYFRLTLPTTSTDTDHKIEHNGLSKYFYNFGAILKYSSRVTKLIVIDGQHRLEALKRLEGRDVVSTIEIPVCIVFPPDAIESNDEDISADLRELFVTVNQQQQRVSGHFLTLLNDASLTAETVRMLGDLWKSELDANTGYTPLQLLEWNQREAKLAFQTTRKFTITTVSIISEALKGNLYTEPRPRTPSAIIPMLNLNAIKSDLETEDDFPALDELWDESFHRGQFELLRGRISSIIVPSLNVLFRKLKPFAAQEAKLKSAFSWLQNEIANGDSTAQAFRDEALSKFRLAQRGVDRAAIITFSGEFQQKATVEAAGSAQYFKYNVFQQAYVRAWIDVSRELLKFEISPVQSALAFVEALNAHCVPSVDKYFAPDQPFTRRLLFSGEKVLLNGQARNAWRDLILVSLGHRSSITALADTLSANVQPSGGVDVTELRKAIENLAVGAARNYLDAYQKVSESDLTKNYFERDLSEDVIGKLSRLERSTNPVDQEAFETEIRALAEARKWAALELLSNLTGIAKTKLVARAEA